MLHVVASFVVAAAVFTPQTTDVQLDPASGAPRIEVGELSPPLQGELVGAVRTWALSQGAHYGLPRQSTLVSAGAYSTRFGASFHLQQQIDGVEVYEAKLVVTLDAQRRVVQVASSLVTSPKVLVGESLTADQVMTRAGSTVPLAGLRPDGVPYGGAKRFFFKVGDELHGGWVANVASIDQQSNWYVGVDGVTGARLFQQNRVHHDSLDAKIYPVSPGGLDAGVGLTALSNAQLRHPDGGTMLGETCVTMETDGGITTSLNSNGELCGDQLMMYNCCPTEGCAPDAGARRVRGAISVMGFAVQYDMAVCDRLRRASNVTNPSANFVYEPFDPPTSATVDPSDRSNSDEFAEVHSFYHVNTVYDWMRKLSVTAQPIFGSNPNIQPFRMRDERRQPAVRVAVWSNVMFPNIQELFAGGTTCLFNPPCRSNTLLRVDNAAFFPREQFNQLPIPGFDTGADTLMIFQGNAADAAYDSTVIQHEFGHGAVYATAALTFDDLALDNRSANNEGGALHEGFADYIAAAFNDLAELGPYFGPRALAGQPATPGVRTDRYLRTMNNGFQCPDVLWGEVHQDSQHVAGALWEGRQAFLGTDQGETFDAAFYAMLVSIAPTADFAQVATAMSARVATAFPARANAATQMTQIFRSRGVIECSKVITTDMSTFPRAYYGIPTGAAGMGSALIPGPVQFKLALPQGASTIRVSTSVGASALPFGMGMAPSVRILAKTGSPITFVRQGNALSNDSMQSAALAVSGNTLSASMTVNAPCNTDLYVTLVAAGGGATLLNVDVKSDPLVNCMIPQPDAGMGGGAGGGGGTTGGGAGGGGSSGGGGGNTMTTTVPAIGENNITSQPAAKSGCGCSSPVDLAAPFLGLVLLAMRRRRGGN